MAAADDSKKHRVQIFVDFWNFSLSMNRVEKGIFYADYKTLAPVLVKAALGVIDAEGKSSGEYTGMRVYLSTDKQSDSEKNLRHWAANTLDRFPGVNVTMVDRVKEVEGPKCPKCHTVTEKCAKCGQDMRGTEEKGVDVRIATDMIMLAWADSYDVAVLVSSDRDFVPVVEFLQTKGKKVILAQFPPRGAHLAQECWGNFDVAKLRESFRMKKNEKKPAKKK